MKDDFGRIYSEVAPRPKGRFPGHTDTCIECGKTIEYGDRYFQRNDPADGTLEQVADLPDPQLAADLMSLTYDPVCEGCGDKLLKHPTS